jgi:hypothetical protein
MPQGEDPVGEYPQIRRAEQALAGNRLKAAQATSWQEPPEDAAAQGFAPVA